MTQTPITSIMDAIAATLATISGLTVNKYDLLTEGLQNAPLCQVYCESEVFDVTTGSDRTTFQGGVRQTEFIVFVDVYARQTRDMGEDMAALYPWVDAIRAKLFHDLKTVTLEAHLAEGHENGVALLFTRNLAVVL